MGVSPNWLTPAKSAKTIHRRFTDRFVAAVCPEPPLLYEPRLDLKGTYLLTSRETS